MCLNQITFGIVLIIHIVSGFNFHSFRNNFEFLTKELNETIVAFDTSQIKTSWFNQPLNNFDKNDNRTWMMRYFERHDLWKPGKPVYIFLGGESSADPVYLKTGIMYDLAQETNGALFIFEHRYYGYSKPFKYFTTKNLEFLSSSQALADFANLLKFIKSSPKFRSSKVVVVGGSYSGNLAAWMKLLYPNLVDAAIASSAPVLAKTDFYEYLETVSEDFKQYGSPGCWDRIAKMFGYYEKSFKSKIGIEALKREENICDYCDMTNQQNQEMFFFMKALQFTSIAQYGNPRDFKKVCDGNFISNFKKTEELSSTWNKKSKCHSYEFDYLVTGWTSNDSYTAFTYQMCTEFGYFTTGSSDKQPFTRNIPIELFYKICTKLFGPDFDKTRVERGVLETNTRYGGLNPNVTNVVFVNGDMDPWSKLGILKDLSHKAPAIIISQASHCKDLIFDDTEELKKARSNIKYLIKHWIGEGKYNKP